MTSTPATRERDLLEGLEQGPLAITRIGRLALQQRRFGFVLPTYDQSGLVTVSYWPIGRFQ